MVMLMLVMLMMLMMLLTVFSVVLLVLMVIMMMMCSHFRYSFRRQKYDGILFPLLLIYDYLLFQKPSLLVMPWQMRITDLCIPNKSLITR